MALIDLHIHSNKSDGEYPPGEVVRLAAGAGLHVMALTDHDTTDGIGEALSAASEISCTIPDKFTGEDTGFKCIPGIEITTDHEHEQHILGYLIHYDKPPFRNFMKRLLAMRRERTCNIIEYLKSRGVPISYEQVRRSSVSDDTNDYIGRPQIASEMIRMGYADSISEVFREYFTGEKFRAVPRPKPSAEESIGEIRAAGGVAVLAHPYSIGLRGPEFAAHLKTLKEQGLEGMECHYGTYTQKDTQACVKLANSLGLIVTGGSDFHGPHIKPDVRIATGMNGMLDFDDMTAVERIEAVST
jgi:predicted metal-dependent phosphoesterase TrpH